MRGQTPVYWPPRDADLRRQPNLEKIQVSYHRNGPGDGLGFYAVLFRDLSLEGDNLLVASVFDEPGRVAVLGVGPLVGRATIQFGHNSWDGGWYEPVLRAMITAYNDDMDQQMAYVEGAKA